MAAERFTDCIVQDVASPARNSLVGGPFGSDLVSKDYVPSGVPVIRGTNMGHGRWIDGEFAYVSPAKADSLSANCAKPGDLVFTQRGTLGQVALVPEKGAGRYLISQSQMKLTVDEAKADALFLYYVFTSAEQQEYIRQNAIQTGVPHTNLGILRNTPVFLPPLAEQKAIAAVLGALDDKIELNRRMNATLEAMARALFQSWFVDFDPVRAKLDGRQPTGLDSATAALFPAALQESAIGLIPKGWEVEPLEALASIRGGKQLPTEDCLPTGKFTVFGANGIMGYTTESTHDGFVIAFGRVGAYCGSIHWSLDSAWINNNASAVVPLRWPGFVLQTMLNIDFNSMRTGSAQPFIPNSSLASAKVLRPTPPIAEAFCRIVEPLRRQQADNDHQSRTLATLRDTLLPKLLSGELSVAAANHQIT
jgi:type I restriction enzyme S subunit